MHLSQDASPKLKEVVRRRLSKIAKFLKVLLQIVLMSIKQPSDKQNKNKITMSSL